MTGIYKITSPSNKVYIGQSFDIAVRFSQHKSLHKKANNKLYNCISKHGWGNCDKQVLHELPMDVEQSVLDRYEVLYMALYSDCGVILLNAKEGGSRGRFDEAGRKRLSILKTGNTNMLGKKHSDETKLKMSIAAKGIPKSMKARENMSKSRAVMTLSETHKQNIGKAGLGRTHTPETKLKMSKWQIGKTVSDITRKKISEVKKINGAKTEKAVLNTHTGVIYRSIAEAAKYYGIPPVTLGHYLIGRYINKTPFIYCTK